MEHNTNPFASGEIPLTARSMATVNPLQGAMLQLCGLVVLRHAARRTTNEAQCEKSLREGRSMLRTLCRRDHGYDLMAWHNDLIRDPHCEYRGGASWLRVKRAVLNALHDPARIAVLERLQFETNASKHR